MVRTRLGTYLSLLQPHYRSQTSLMLITRRLGRTKASSIWRGIHQDRTQLLHRPLSMRTRDGLVDPSHHSRRRDGRKQVR